MGRYAAAWDEVRSAVGAVFGNIVSLGETNILVEGVSDQVLIAGVCARFEEEGKSLLNLFNTSIIPFREDPELRRLLALSAQDGRRSIVVVDLDEGGRRHAKVAAEEFKVPVISVTDPPLGDASVKRTIEDLVAVSTYVEAVNQYYEELGTSWFQPIRVDEAANQALTHTSIEQRINEQFSRFARENGEARELDKAAVAIRLGQRIAGGEVLQESFSGLVALIERCEAALGAMEQPCRKL